MLGILSILSGGVPIFLLPLLLWVVLDLVWIGTRDFHDGQGRRICTPGPPTTHGTTAALLCGWRGARR